MKKLWRWAGWSVGIALALAAILLVWERSRWELIPAREGWVGEERIYDSSYDDVVARAAAILGRFQDRSDLPAVSFAVGVDGHLVWASATGFANLERREPVRLESRFRIGSISKSVTSVAMARLMERGELDLDAPIRNYLPDTPLSAYPITARQLASHTAGLRHYKWSFSIPPNDFLSRRQFDTVRESLSAFEEEPLLFEPGTRYSYSTPGFTLLSVVMEAADGREFLALLDEEVFEPLGMSDTSADFTDRQAPNRVSFYDTKKGRFKSAYRVNLSNKWAGGGLLSTASDLVRMGNGILNGTYLRPETLKALFEPQKLANGDASPASYALGWRSQWTESSHIVHHGGSSSGATGYLLIVTGERLVFAMLTNAGNRSGTLRRAVMSVADEFVDKRKLSNSPKDFRPWTPLTQGNGNLSKEDQRWSAP